MLSPPCTARARVARQSGMTLTGLMIGMTLGTLVLSGISTLYLLSVQGSTDTLRAIRLNQELRSVIELMQQDIRRAGYWAAAHTEDPAENPFQSEIAAINNDLSIGAALGEPDASCLVYSYDLNDNGAIGVCDGCALSEAPFDAAPYDQSNVEMFGFRLRNGAVQMRARRANQSEIAFDCRSGWWEAITSHDVRITRLEFTLMARESNLNPNKAPSVACMPEDACRLARAIEVRLAGRARSDPRLHQSLAAIIAVRNDRQRRALTE